ncbi:MAG: hypothetical protein V1742_04640, partial [Pseudomonadota bacterium]
PETGKVPAKGGTKTEREARKRAEAEARRRLYGLKAPLIEEIERLEKRLDELGARQDDLALLLAEPGTYQDPDQARGLNLEYNEIKAEMEELTRAWEKAALKMEEIEAGLVEEGL